MKLKNIMQASAGAVGFIALFLPWYVVSFWGMSVSGNAFSEVVTVIGVLALLLSLGAIAWFVLDMLGLIKLNLPEKTMKIIDTVIGGVMALLGVIAMIIVSSQSSGLGHAGFGTWLYIIAGAVIIVLTWIKMEQTVGKAPKTKKVTTKKEK